MKNFLRCCVIAYEIIALAVILSIALIILDPSNFRNCVIQFGKRIEEIIIGIEEFLDKPFETWDEVQQQSRDLIAFTVQKIYE